MTSRLVLPYGSWRSPITAELIASDALGLTGIWLDGEDAYWSELRGAENGRNALVRCRSTRIDDVLPLSYSARSRVNEYGGGAFTVSEGVVYFVNNTDQRIYRSTLGTTPTPLTPSDARRYADLVFDRSRQRLIAVCEDHRDEGESSQSIVAIDADNAREPITLVSGRDFYAAPRPSPDGRSLAFIAWDHPRMPWDGSDLFLAVVTEDGYLERVQRVAGGEEESVQQPCFAPEGVLYFVSDRTGWWNLYRFGGGAVEPMLVRDAEFGVPPWVFGLSTYAFASARRIVCVCSERAEGRLLLLDTASGDCQAIDTPYCDIAYLRASGDRAWFVAAGPKELPAVVELNLTTRRCQVLRRSTSISIAENDLSIGQPIEYFVENGERVHAFFYRPLNANALAPAGERPPLLVMSHGGPSSATNRALNLKIQYWTSRGFAVLDVNYRGSTGYGRPYRRRLDGGWGIVDVEDCIAGALHLVALGEVDGSRLAIRGGSAGGYTTLCALAFHDVFRAGASYYGISDLELLVRDTHKFESRYLDRLVGAYPEKRERYRERSPIHYAERLNCPVIFFQGAEDRVVPPNQTERLVQALRARAIPVAHLLFAGEQHGFRRAENVKRALESELYFYGRVFGFATDVDASVPDPFL